ncbi:putative WEB family protein, chloroplastic [Capsicum galapagoense]
MVTVRKFILRNLVVIQADLSVPVLIRTIRRLTKEKVQMASKVSSMLQNQVAKRASAKEEANISQVELDSRIRRLEIEKNELQSILEKELDRRSSDCYLKLEKYKIEQHRLRERARELAEQNVSLQREVSSFNKKEVDNRIKMSFLEKHLEDLSKRIEQVSEENQNLRQQLTQLQEEYRLAKDNRDYIRENYQQKVKDLKLETLLTIVLREKLYFEEMDIKQLQADLAAAVRGNDILKCEVQNVLDALSCATPKLKYLELQVLKKDKNINQLINDLQECMKELGVMKGILPKVFQERDFIWEEAKRYSEIKMLLNYEINMLNNKVDTLDEDILMKEGQIIILKDWIGKPFDLLASPNSLLE